MSIEPLLQRLAKAGVANVGEPLDESWLASATPARLPEEYVTTLTRFNGFSVHYGMNRLFGIRADVTMDMRSWNQVDAWRFAWDSRINPFFCIGETAFGDQYALMLAEGGIDFLPEVFLLEANFLQPVVVGATFGAFLHQELVRNAEAPWDEVAIEAVSRYGPIDVTNNWAYAPSIALGGSEDVANLMSMDCFTAMTIAGDIASAIQAAPDDAELQGVAPYGDDRGRSRLRVIFE
jgi:hypothetical protein